MKYDQVNHLIDHVMKHCDGNVFKIVSIVARETLGWGRQRAKISFRQFQRKSGIKSMDTIKKAIETAIEIGFVVRSKSGRSFEYAVTFTDPSFQNLERSFVPNSGASNVPNPGTHKRRKQTKRQGKEINIDQLFQDGVIKR